MFRGSERQGAVRRLAVLLLAAAMAGCSSTPEPTPAERQEQLVQRLVTYSDSLYHAAYGMVDQLRAPSDLARVVRGARIQAIRHRACWRITDRAILFDLVMADAAAGVCRNHAVDTIRDPGLLTRIAFHRPDAAASVIHKLDDDPNLERIATSHPQDKARQLAQRRLDKVRKDRRIAAVKATTDQARLRQVVFSDTDHGAKEAAVDGITDPAILSDIAFDRSLLVPIRHRAVARLTDQNRLADIAVRADDWGVRQAAIKALTDPDLLFHVARNGPERDPEPGSNATWDSRVAATRKIDDQAHLRQIATGDPKANVRIAALRRLADPATLARAARDGADERERLEAVARLRDPALLGDLAARGDNRAAVAALRLALVEAAAGGPVAPLDLDWSTASRSYGGLGGTPRAEASGPVITLRIGDGPKDQRPEVTFHPPFPQSVRVRLGRKGTRTLSVAVKIDRTQMIPALSEHLEPLPAARRNTLARTARSPLLRAAALGVATDRAVIAAGLDNADAAVRGSAIGRLGDPALMARLARTDPDPGNRAAAVAKVTDRALLAALARDDRSGAVRQAAKARLKDLELVR